jgi:MoaA/NifB/PqqE/SkfB family radical SAM enzyme
MTTSATATIMIEAHKPEDVAEIEHPGAVSALTAGLVRQTKAAAIVIDQSRLQSLTGRLRFLMRSEDGQITRVRSRHDVEQRLEQIRANGSARERADIGLLAAISALYKDDFYRAAEHLFRWLADKSHASVQTVRFSQALKSRAIDEWMQGWQPPERMIDRVSVLLCWAADSVFHGFSEKAFPALPSPQADQASSPVATKQGWRYKLRLLAKGPACKLDFVEQLLAASSHQTERRALALALARFAALNADLARAEQLLSEACEKHTHHVLRNALNAVQLKRDGKAVPHFLQKFLGHDDGYLLERTCRHAFERFDVDEAGGVMVCCGHWMPDTKIGNLFTDSAEEIINSQTAQDIRRSVIDGSFHYCDVVKCPLISGDLLQRKDEVTDPTLRRGIDENEFRIDAPAHMVFAFDQTCNLSCPSCRTRLISDKKETRDRKAEMVEQKIIPLLHTAKSLMLNVAGEIFASKSSRALLARLNRRDFPDLKLEIISNGTLFTEEEWNKFPNVHDMTQIVRVSIDGVKKETVESLRRGLQFETFQQNMRFISTLRSRGIIETFRISFSYQVENFREMPDFVRYGKSLGCDAVLFEKLENLGAYSTEEYKGRAVHKRDHPLHGEFLEIIKDPLLRDPCVWADFEYQRADHTAETATN